MGSHPFPFRTRKLSPPAPMVLGTWVPGRVGRCRINNAKGGTEKSRPVRVSSSMRYGCPMGKPKGNREKGRPAGNRSRDRRSSPNSTRDKKTSDSTNVPKNWGSVARHGAGKLKREELEDKEERDLKTSFRSPTEEATQIESSDRLRSEAEDAIDRARKKQKNTNHKGNKSKKKRVPTPNIPNQLPDPGRALRKILGEKRGARAVSILEDAAKKFEDEKFSEAHKKLSSLDEKSLKVAEVVELFGLVSYRLGKWVDAAEYLESFRLITGSTEQHPVLADCYRAQKNFAEVEILWDELRKASPSAALVTEGRLVAAGSLDDQGKTSEAVRILEKGWKVPRKPKDHHLRRAYALGDLYEKSGSLPRARELFIWIRRHSPKFADVGERVRDLS